MGVHKKNNKIGIIVNKFRKFETKEKNIGWRNWKKNRKTNNYTMSKGVHRNYREKMKKQKKLKNYKKYTILSKGVHRNEHELFVNK